MTITPIPGTDTVSFIEQSTGVKATAQVVVPVNADGTAMSGGTTTSPTIVAFGPGAVIGDGLSSSTNTVTFYDSTGASRQLLRVVGHHFNGSTLDRMRGDTTGTFVKSNPLTGTDRSVTATTTSAALMAANTTRTKFFVKNDSTIVVWINMGATAVATAGTGNIAIAANGGYFEFAGYSGAVNIIATSTTAAITAREF